MKNLLIAFSIIAMCSASPTYATTADCFASIDGDEILAGPCDLKNTDGIVLTFRDAPPAEASILIVVGLQNRKAVVISTMLGYQDYGIVTPLDACWINDRVRICAWPMAPSSQPLSGQ